VKIKQTTFEYIGHGAPETATLSEVAGVVILEMWGGENTYTFQTIGMQSGDHTFSFVDASVDSPIEQELITFEARGDAWEIELRKVVDQLAHRLAHPDTFDLQTPMWHSTTRKLTRAIAEESERLIAEHVYKALLRAAGHCCPECGAEDPRDGAPGCSVCRQVLGELVKEAELAAGWNASP
jgi:hypothetical protein